MYSSEIEKRIAFANKYFENISDEELKKMSKEEYSRAEADFKKLKECLENGKCSFCGKLISHFSDKKPCFHWFLKPKGFKKKHFPLLYEKYSFRRIEAYLRWVANTDVPVKNINNLVEEKNSSKKIELTITYKNLEWSFSCSKSDFQGHKNRRVGREPHYHFQMKKDGFVIINYNGFHIPFHEKDFFDFALEEGRVSKARFTHVHGAGMQEFFDNFSAEELANKMIRAENEENAQFHTSIFFQAKPGTTISGSDIAKLLEEQKRTGVAMVRLIHKLPNAEATSIISPGPGVPELAKRKQRRGNLKSREFSRKMV